ncbi:MAG: dTMP kinase [Chlorobiaceae bacterium]|jgi:dTMP kinase|nr:dTMP kinase [Chlorobiaceae bacterium]
MLITFEGIDGAGKSTQITKLIGWFERKGIETISLREPGGTDAAEKIRRILLDSSGEITPLGELLLFSASRAELVQQVIIPALESEKTVILDRFYDSTTAYQGYGRGLDLDMLRSIIQISTCGIVPDITVFLDLDPETALKRKFAEKSIPIAFDSDELDRMERSGLEFYRKVHQGYRETIRQNANRFVILDAKENADIIHLKIKEIIRQRFPFSAAIKQ